MNGRIVLLPEALLTYTSCGPEAVEGSSTKVAVICEAFTTTTFRTAAPMPLRRITVPEAKLAPDKITLTEVPAFPVLGAIDVNVVANAEGVTRNGKDAVVAPAVVTVTLYVPTAAIGLTLNTALIWMALGTETADTLTPLPLIATVAPAVKFVPLMFTSKFVPTVPPLGDSEVRAGCVADPAFTVNVTGLLVPPAVETETAPPPAGALAAMASVAEI